MCLLVCVTGGEGESAVCGCSEQDNGEGGMCLSLSLTLVEPKMRRD